MTTTPGAREAARSLVLEIKRSGFSQLRKTNDGFLYGSGTYRFTVPYSVAQGSAHPDFTDQLAQDFRKVRDKRDAEYGKPRHPYTEGPIAPSINPEDLLVDEGGPPVADTEVVNLAGGGSTPPPPATNADAGWGPETAILAPEGSSPSVGTIPSTPNPEEETTMPRVKLNKRGRRYPDPWTCPKCGETFQAKGRHEASCKGKPKEAKVRRAPREPVTAEAASTNGHSTTSVEAYREHFTSFTKAHADFLVLMDHMEGEMRILRRENEELRAFKQRASALFEPSSKVPRG